MRPYPMRNLDLNDVSIYGGFGQYPYHYDAFVDGTLHPAYHMLDRLHETENTVR